MNDQNNTLCHYTDLTGLIGIIGSGSFWATNLAFMNDKSELVHGLDCAKKAIRFMQPSPLFSDWSQDFTDAIDRIKERDINDIFTVSFCRNPDLLSQWRGYGKAQGVSLVLDQTLLVNRFEAFIKRENTKPDKGMRLDHYYMINDSVTYNRPEETFELKNKLQSHIDGYAQFVEEVGTDAPDQFAYLQHMISQVAPFFKHSGFSEEEEYRIVIRTLCGDNKIKFRTNDKMIIPYIPILLTGENKLPLREIKVGPCEDFTLVRKGIELLLTVNGYSDVNITLSTIPYRG
ncbi:hypothetical protein WP5S18E01_22940 [Enterobacter cloacae]|nr:hypothetical protein WP5S18E01_22940 [Enterobacter cloacae]